MTIIAKPVVDKKFWILQENNQKIGNIEACAGGYQIKINNQTTQFKSIRMLTRQINITFEPVAKAAPKPRDPAFLYGFPTQGRIHNPMWDVSQQLPVYTRTAKSKSWYAAGWYNVRKGRNWRTVFVPKLIFLQRYPYQGPFSSEQQAHDSSS